MSENYDYVFKTNKKVSLSFTDTYKCLGFASKKIQEWADVEMKSDRPCVDNCWSCFLTIVALFYMCLKTSSIKSSTEVSLCLLVLDIRQMRRGMGYTVFQAETKRGKSWEGKGKWPGAQMGWAWSVGRVSSLPTQWSLHLLFFFFNWSIVEL